ncbi:MFS transporter [Kingella kingae]|nr:MFS transporter [Kingella kingae]MDK4564702.1 MFS transporter [Kingella kingae]
MSGNNIDVRELLDSRDVSAYQKFIVFISFLIVVMDGFDVVIMGFVGPALKEAWNWTNSDLATVLSAALFGLTFGALTAGPLGDKFGRRKVLTASVFIFGLFTLLVATASSKTEFIVYRFIAGFAMGGIMPMVATLVKEYSPVKRVSLLVTIVFAGFTVGAAGGGFLAAWMVPHFGWASVFVLGGVLPIITAVVMFFTLPESLTFLVLKGGQREEICKIVERCAPGVTTADTTFTVPTPPNTSTDVKESPIQIALNGHYRLGSILLWSSYFLHLFLVYLLGSWMPTMIKESGMTTSQAAIISAMFQLGGPLGSVMLGWFMDKFEPHRVITSAYVLGAIMLVVMSNIGGEYLLMCIVAFVIGAGFNGGGTAMNALSSNFFPLPARATGNSWMHGI